MLASSAECGTLFLMWTVAWAASGQKKLDILPSRSIAHTIDIMEPFAHSVTPFCCGAPGFVFSYDIPLLEQNCLNSLAMYSGAWSHQITEIFWEV